MLIIASRKSRLAMWQAKHVQSILNQKAPNVNVEILGVSTKGDEVLDRSLSKIGGKGLFVKELEVAILENKAHLAVHSLKDVPMILPKGFKLGAILKREDPRDALVSNKFKCLDEFPKNSIIGTSSLRREFQLKVFRPDFNIVPLRGNLDTRLKKLDEGRMDGIILAAAGLIRLGSKDRIEQFVSPEILLPAAGQGAIAIEVLSSNNEVHRLINSLSDSKTSIEVEAERTVSRQLNASCQLPLAVFCERDNEKEIFHLKAKLAMPDGSKCCFVNLNGNNANELANIAVENLIAQGAKKIIDALR